MGIVLVVGIIVLIALVIQRNINKPDKVQVQAGVAPAPITKAVTKAENCPSQEFVVQESGDIQSYTYNNDGTLTIMLLTDEGQKIITIDLCSYKVLHKVTVKD